MTSPSADAGAGGIRMAWLGHAAGRRADGLTSYSEQVTVGLERRGAEVYFHHARSDGEEVPGKPAAVVAWPTLNFKTVTLPRPGFRHRMGRWLEENRPDITHCSVSFTLADGWVGERALGVGSATVATFHLPFGTAGTGRAAVMRELHRFWARRLRSYERVIVFSQEHRERLTAVGFSGERLRVVPNAVDVTQFAPGPSRLRSGLLRDAELVIGYAGRLDPEKGVRQLLRAFTMADLGPNARLLLAGNGVLRPMVERAAARDPRVVYRGQVVGVASRTDFWRAVDLFCLPSSAEGLSISMLEAMATGCAVAVTRAGGLPAAGGCGLELDERRLTDSLTERLRQLWTDRATATRLGARCRSEAVHHHSMDAMLDRLMEIYSEIKPDLMTRTQSTP